MCVPVKRAEDRAAVTAPGTFAHRDARFAGFLWHQAVATASTGQNAFVARNFLLDERVPAIRADSYVASGVPATWREWIRLHRMYEAERLRIPPRMGKLPLPFEMVGSQDLPETFEVRPNGDEFYLASGELHLVRVESVGRMAEAAGLDPFDLVARLQQYTTGADPNPTDRLWLLSVLDAYASTQPLRPVFAGFAEDVRGVLGAPTATTRSTLAQLRDRLGLLHYDPADTGPVPLAVFRYPVEALPRIEGVAGIALISPTVLESGQSAGFCPCPRGTQFGTAVDLSPISASPAREAVHLPFRYSPDHLALAGLLEDAVLGTLAALRVRHLRALRRLGGGDYADTTDADILASEDTGET